MMPRYRIKVKAGKWRNSQGQVSDLSAREFIVEAKDQKEARQKARSRMYGFQQSIESIKKDE